MLVRARSEDCDEEGFILLESIICIALIAFIIAALTTFFVNSTADASQLRAKQGAVVVADNAVDQLRALQPSDTYAGRSSGAVTTEFSTANALVSPWLTNMYPSYDNSGASTKFPISQTQTIGSTSYTTTSYIGACALPLASSDGTACLTQCPVAALQLTGTCTAGYSSSISVADFLRVVVAVTWPDTHCASSTCAYVTSTLISADSDPDFYLNDTPPNAPAIASIAAQTAAINDTVSVQLTDSSGVHPVTWSATNLPNGLSVDSASGVISGTVGGAATSGSTGSLTSTITLTDAYGRTANATMSWTILADITVSGASAQNVVPGAAISAVTLSATGGSGSPFTWSAPSSGAGALPTGLSISSSTGQISGTPTTPGTYSSVITVADKSGRTRTQTMNWTVYAVPGMTGLNDAQFLGGWKPSMPLPVTCPSSYCTFTLSGAPTGIGLATTSTATTGAASITVTSTSATLYAVGTTPTSGSSPWSLAVNTTEKANGVTATQSAAADTATWTLGLTTVSTTAGSAYATQVLNYTCSVACTASITSKLSTAPTAVAQAWLAPDASATTATTALAEPSGTGVLYVRGSMPAARGSYTVSLSFAVTGTGTGTLPTTATSTWVAS